MIYFQFTGPVLRTSKNRYSKAQTYIIIGILVIDIRGKLFAQNPQLTLDVARMCEYFVHVIVLFRKPLGDIHHDKIALKRACKNTDLINFHNNKSRLSRVERKKIKILTKS